MMRYYKYGHNRYIVFRPDVVFYENEMDELKPSLLPPRKSKSLAYVNVVETVYHQRVGGQPTGIPRRFRIACESGEQPFGPRHLTIDETWQPLDTGWIVDPILLEVFNDTGTQPVVNPTPEERDRIGAAVVEIGIAIEEDDNHKCIVALTEVKAGTNVRLQPLRDMRYVIRSRCGIASVQVTAYAR